MKLHADVFGEGPNLVLLHGFTGSAATWAPYRDALTGFRVIAIDLPGHGRTDVAPDGATFEDIADATVASARAHGADRAAWLGYSMGGRVALQVAARHPACVSRLVVESASPGLRSPEERSHRTAADDALAARILEGGLEAFVDRWAAQPLFASQKRLPPATLARERDARLANSAEGIAGGLRAMSVGRQPSLWEALEGMHMASLVVVGADDTKYVALGREAAERLPHARLEILYRAGHTVHLEQPSAFWAIVRSFLEESR